MKSRPQSRGDEARPLAAQNVYKSFGGLRVLRGISLELHAGEVCGLIGPNGAGKSTLFNILTGHLPGDGGDVLLFGREVTGERPHVLARRGLIRSFQSPKTVEDETVLENAAIGAQFCGFDLDAARENARRLLTELGVPTGDWAKRPAEVTPPVRRMTQIVRTLTMNPKVVLLDEPMAGLDGNQIERVCRLISRLAEEGMSILLVEHRIDAVMAVAHRALVLAGGHIIFEGRPEAAKEDARVQTAYFGVSER